MSRLPTLRAAAEEPYRLFFPLGILVGLIGVALWPAWLAGWLSVYPGLAHARLLTEGFLFAFILGFLGTAGPRMLEARPLAPLLWAVLLATWSLGQVASLAQAHNLAEGAFIAVLVGFLAALASRARQRSGLPPPGIVLIALSLALAIPAALTQMPAMSGWFPGLPLTVGLVGRSFLHETWILLAILGASPFFFGRFGGLPPRHQTRETASPDAVWRRQAGLCLATGGVLILAIALKAVGYGRAGAAVQMLASAAFIWTQVPFRYPRPVATLARLAQAALLSLVLAPFAEAIWPSTPLAWKHFLFIVGFQGAVFSVGTWVAFAHAGRRARCAQRWRAIAFLGAGWLGAALSRAAAELAPASRESHYAYAALFWIAASLGWLWILLPRLREND